MFHKPGDKVGELLTRVRIAQHFHSHRLACVHATPAIVHQNRDCMPKCRNVGSHHLSQDRAESAGVAPITATCFPHKHALIYLWAADSTVDGILKNAWNRVVVFGCRDEQTVASAISFLSLETASGIPLSASTSPS